MDRPTNAPRTPPVRRPLVIGIVGGVGSGKSAVAKLLSERGAVILDADRMAHEALETDSVREALVGRFGQIVLLPNGMVDRPALGKLVFGGKGGAGDEAKKFLEDLLHPQIRARILEQLAELRRIAAHLAPAWVVLDAPLLLEGPLADLCDTLVFVEAPEDLRTARTVRHRGWAYEERAAREAKQLPIDLKRARCQHIIRNDGDLMHLEQEVAHFLSALDLSN
ncbi:MAG TPA: dephospho-CoA kinase [Planctomycetota bacterium]|jgi:dephospho-CoA kinase|nr:dephospho-CoA kinase [Planctomycetota bacterium]